MTPQIDIHANLIDITGKIINEALIRVWKGKIDSVQVLGPENSALPFICPGFIDSHVHVESSMLVPSEFARLAVVHGTVGTISDPHEIANVCGMEGVRYMIENGKTVPFKFHFGAPSCVPATIFETAGASLDSNDVSELLQDPDIYYLSEMMNFPGVLNGDPEVMQKIASAHAAGKPVDGHAPGLRGDAAKAYIAAGISTDHECFTEAEALDKLQFGMKILIREGSAARNFDALIDLLANYPDQIMFCSDDKHPDSLEAGHINQLCARAVAKGIDLFHVLQAACINPVHHYNMNVGLLREGDPADFILLKDLKQFEVLETWINGERVAQNGQSLVQPAKAGVMNQFNCAPVRSGDLVIPYSGGGTVPVIEALDGQLITNRTDVVPLLDEAGRVLPDTSRDLLKMVVVNRYFQAPVAACLVQNFGLHQGAIASTVAHDSHNIIAVGADDESLERAINQVIAMKGGICAVSNQEIIQIALPVAGLMTNQNGYAVSRDYTTIDRFVKETLGSKLGAPFMTLSFMALLVIPHLKLSDKGLFDGDGFTFIKS